MAIYIDLSLGSTLDLPSQVGSTSTSWRVSIKWRHDGVAGDEIALINRSTDFFFISILMTPDVSHEGALQDRYAIRTEGGNGSSGFRYDFPAEILDGEFHIVDFYCDGTTLFMDIDGTNFSSQGFTKVFSGWDRLLAHTRPASLEYIKFYESSDTSVLVHSWDANNSDTTNTGAQPVLVDSVSAFNATGTGFPTDGTAFGEVVSPPSLTVTQTALTPGGTISGTYSNYDTIPTTLTVSDGTNTITIASPTITDNGDGTGSFSGTMPALPTTGTANLVLFGNVTVELT